MADQHTPGPWIWTFEDRDLGFVNEPSTPVLRGPDKKAIIEAFAFYDDAGLRSEYPQETAEANARLIASAPELLVSLGKFVALANFDADTIPKTTEEWDLMVAEAESVIRKAKGE